MSYMETFKIFLYLFLSVFLINPTQAIYQHRNTDSIYLVELLVFSGTENPKWTINHIEYEKLNQQLQSNKIISQITTRVMGYKGFKISSMSNENISYRIINNTPLAELFLLKTIRQNIHQDVIEHVFQVITSNIVSLDVNDWVSNYSENPQIIKNSPFLNEYFLQASCDATPIKGPDSVPDFNPDKNNYGCFEEKQWENNCYNYGNDIVTNTFAQP
jgi:hypothetical protein